MIRRYRVELVIPGFPQSKGTVTVGRCRTVASAARRAAKVLRKHPTVQTRALRARWYEIWEALITDERTGRLVDSIEAPIVIVKSVGELGYAPL